MNRKECRRFAGRMRRQTVRFLLRLVGLRSVTDQELVDKIDRGKVLNRAKDRTFYLAGELSKYAG